MNAPDSFRSRLDALMNDPQGRSIENIQRRLAQLEYPAAAVLLYTRARCNEPVPIDLVCEVIARGDTLPLQFILFLVADGDRVAAIVNMVETAAFPRDPIGMMFTAAFVLAADRLDDSHQSRPRLAAGVRVLASACLELPPSSLRTHVITAFQLVAKELKDAILVDMLPRTVSGTLSPEFVMALQCMQHPRDQLLALPTLYDDSCREVARKINDIATFAPVPTRNAPCWCKSGKKYKRCHGGDEPATRPRDALEARDHRTFTAFEVQTCPLGNLAKMRFPQLGDEPLVTAIDRLLKYRAWDLAERAIDELASRQRLGLEAPDGWRNRLVSSALECRRWDLVAKHVKRLRSSRYSRMKENVELLLPVVERAPDAIDHLIRFAERAVHTPDGAADAGVALLLHGMPALGILLLRAQIAAGAVGDDDRDEFTAIDQARLRLGLPPKDPAETVFDQRQAAIAKAREAEAQARLTSEAQAERDALRSQLVEANRQCRDLARRVDDLERQLRGQTVAPIVVQADADPAELRALRVKVEQLQDLIRDKNLELANLRREVRSGGASSRAYESNANDNAALERDALESLDEDRWEVENNQAQERRTRIPVWRPDLVADLESIPAHVVREALRTIADLATGESAAWRAVKVPRGIATPVRMVRIGIHHRLLFCTSDRSIDVMELVSRESLNLALKRYM